MLLPKNNFLKYQVYQSDIEELPNWEICVAMPDFGHTQFQSWQRQHTNIKDFFIPSKFNCEKIAYQSFARAKKLHLCFAADARWPLQLHKCIIVKIFDNSSFPIRFIVKELNILLDSDWQWQVIFVSIDYFNCNLFFPKNFKL